jgi:hypothetical protein
MNGWVIWWLGLFVIGMVMGVHQAAEVLWCAFYLGLASASYKK